MSTLAFYLLLVLAGWILRGVVGGVWRRVYRPHRFGDSQHLWTEFSGRVFAFTDDQLDAAESRAQRLTDPRRRWLKRFAWLTVFGGLVLLAFTGCKTTGTPAPRVVVTPTGPATVAEIAGLKEQIAELRASFETQRDLAQIAAGAVYGASEANAGNPLGLPREATAAQLEEAARALPAPTDAQKLEKANQNARILAGELVAVKAEMGQKASQIDALQASLSASEKRAADAEAAQARLEAAGVKERAEAAAKLQAQFDDFTRRINAAHAETARVRNEERKSMLRKLGYVLLGLGTALTLAGAGIAFVTKGLEWQRAAIAAAFGGLFFAMYWTMNQPWFKWLVIGVVVCAVGAAIWWLVKERQTAIRTTEADEAEDTLKRIIAAVDELGETATVAEVRATIGRSMNDNNKALVHELRAESKRAVAATP